MSTGSQPFTSPSAAQAERKASSPIYRAFSAYGVELEYMIVDRATLDVAPLADRVLALGGAEWANELAAHVVELRNPVPSHDLPALAARFRGHVRQMNAALSPLGARLMPGAMHPWMDPLTQTRLWRHGNASVYRAYHRIFDCRGHGWSNVQSVQVNLPFAGDTEFARLHRAVRLAMPLLPAIAAASPFQDGRVAGPLDCRMASYAANSLPVPQMTGRLIPEPVTSRAQYEREILQPLYEALEAHDPERVLRHEWANARGAIARFDRGAIEIRVLDMQECPGADVALAALAVDLVHLFYREGLPEAPTDELVEAFNACVLDADRARIDAPAYLKALRLPAGEARELWSALGARLARARYEPLWRGWLDTVLARGPLARRMLRLTGHAPGRPELAALGHALCECLEADRRLDPSSSS